MALLDLLERQAVGAGIALEDRDEVLRWFASRFEGAGVLPDAGPAFLALLEREQIASTVLVEGIAIPHARIPGARRLAFGVLRPGRPVIFAGQRPAVVELVFAIVGPPEETAGHVALLGGLARLIENRESRQALLEASSAGELLDALVAATDVRG